MKKKWLWVAVVVLLLLVVGAVGYYKFAKKTAQVPVAMTTEEHPGVFGTIQQALSGNLSLECHFTSDDGTATAAYIKMGAVHVDSNVGKPNAMSFIMKDKKIYFWQVGSTTGTMMTVPDVTITPGVAQPTPTNSSGSSTGAAQNSGASMLATLEKFKNSCKPAVVADSLFTPPSNVKFTDMSEAMKQMMPSGAPSGAVVPSGMSQEQIKQVMQQYGQPTAAAGY